MKIAPGIIGGWGRAVGGLLGFALVIPALAQDVRFTNILRLTNGQVVLTFNSPSGVNYRIDVATNLSLTNSLRWNSLLRTDSVGLNQFTDVAASASAGLRLYRARSSVLSGDTLVTTNGDLVLHPLYHASFVMDFNGRIIYSDPDDDATYEARYNGLPRGELILITHEHQDHYAPSKLTALRATNGVIIVPQRVYNMTSFASFRPNAFVLHYGESTNVNGINVEAVPGYNGNHAYTTNNCYVVTMGGKRIFISGDTGDVPEIRAVTNIDVAFLCMNLPFTTNWIGATNMVLAMRPQIVYPYHYRDSPGNTVTNPPLFKQALTNEPGIEVRLRSWY